MARLFSVARISPRLRATACRAFPSYCSECRRSGASAARRSTSRASRCASRFPACSLAMAPPSGARRMLRTSTPSRSWSRSPTCARISMLMREGGGKHRSSRILPTSIFACGAMRTMATAMRWRWPTSRCRRWRRAASTTSSAGASRATAPMRRGPSRTSRRCFTTTARSSRCWPTRIQPPESRSTRVSLRKPPAGSCARCNRPTAATTPASMPIPKASKASSTSGSVRKCARS